MAARTFRGKVRRLAREIRKAKKCERCGTAVLRGALVQYGPQTLCQPCVVKVVRGREPRQERRQETA